MTSLLVIGPAKGNRIIQILSAINYRFLGPDTRSANSGNNHGLYRCHTRNSAIRSHASAFLTSLSTLDSMAASLHRVATYSPNQSLKPTRGCSDVQVLVSIFRHS